MIIKVVKFVFTQIEINNDLFLFKKEEFRRSTAGMNKLILSKISYLGRA
jgi:hypothetical protein